MKHLCFIRLFLVWIAILGYTIWLGQNWMINTDEKFICGAGKILTHTFVVCSYWQFVVTNPVSLCEIPLIMDPKMCKSTTDPSFWWWYLILGGRDSQDDLQRLMGMVPMFDSLWMVALDADTQWMPSTSSTLFALFGVVQLKSKRIWML